MFHIHLGLDGLAKTMVITSYVLWFFALGFMVVQGFRQKSYGMPPFAITSMLGVCLICCVGPWIEPSLFYPKDHLAVVWCWRGWAMLMLLLFFQYLIWGKHYPYRILEFKKHFYLIAFGSLFSSIVMAWTFINFYQDYYVNSTCALFAVLPMSIGYFGTLYTRPKLRGLSVTVAWCLTIGTALLYGGTVLGGMDASYPKHTETGYHFIYALFLVTVVLNVAYSIMLTRRRHELHEDYDHKITLRRLHGFDIERDSPAV